MINYFLTFWEVYDVFLLTHAPENCTVESISTNGSQWLAVIKLA